MPIKITTTCSHPHCAQRKCITTYVHPISGFSVHELLHLYADSDKDDKTLRSFYAIQIKECNESVLMANMRRTERLKKRILELEEELKPFRSPTKRLRTRETTPSPQSKRQKLNPGELELSAAATQ